MTSKERANLKAQANSLPALFQLGKGGISAAFIRQTEIAFETRELVKLKVLTDTSPVTPDDAAREVAEKTNSEVVQVIGGVMIFYKYNPKLHEKK